MTGSQDVDSAHIADEVQSCHNDVGPTTLARKRALFLLMPPGRIIEALVVDDLLRGPTPIKGA